MLLLALQVVLRVSHDVAVLLALVVDQVAFSLMRRPLSGCAFVSRMHSSLTLVEDDLLRVLVLSALGDGDRVVSVVSLTALGIVDIAAVVPLSVAAERESVAAEGRGLVQAVRVLRVALQLLSVVAGALDQAVVDAVLGRGLRVQHHCLLHCGNLVISYLLLRQLGLAARHAL